ncbi:MAG: ATP-dependent metallopeptidase FtsH/Yme1/Tma family protein, partial [Clostridium sp.]|nr:ATP-dependent metallopeptidase FtsH/Yme1/Tma family protein [Clostridium sp.]
MKKVSSATAWIIVLIVVILAALALVETNRNAGVISYDQFKKYWVENNISRIQVKQDRRPVIGELKDKNKPQFEAVVPEGLLIEDLFVKNPNPSVDVRFEPPTSIPVWVNWLPTIVLILMLVGFWFMFMQQS